MRLGALPRRIRIVVCLPMRPALVIAIVSRVPGPQPALELARRGPARRCLPHFFAGQLRALAEQRDAGALRRAHREQRDPHAVGRHPPADPHEGCRRHHPGGPGDLSGSTPPVSGTVPGVGASTAWTASAAAGPVRRGGRRRVRRRRRRGGRRRRGARHPARRARDGVAPAVAVGHEQQHADRLVAIGVQRACKRSGPRRRSCRSRRSPAAGPCSATSATRPTRRPSTARPPRAASGRPAPCPRCAAGVWIRGGSAEATAGAIAAAATPASASVATLPARPRPSLIIASIAWLIRASRRE